MIPKIRVFAKAGTKEFFGGGYDRDQMFYEISEIDFYNKTVTVWGCHNKDCGMCDDTYKIEDVEVMMSTGLKDADGVEIFNGDIVVASTGYYLNGIFNPMRHYKGVVKFGEYEQNASGGEYSGSKTIGFYGEFSCVNDGDDGYKKIESHDYEREESLLTFGKTEVIGNIYESPELLEVAE